MKRWTTALGALALTTTLTDCAVVLDPVLPDGATSAVAILARDLPASTLDAGVPASQYPPDSLVLMWSNQAQPCASPDVGPPALTRSSGSTRWSCRPICP